MIKIICLGKIKEKYLEDLINDYQKRISKYHKLEIIELKDINDLDKGKKFNSLEFANLIDKTFLDYSNITFIIGSSEGLSGIIKDKANMLLSFSDMTFPHGLFRGLLLEQIYRSFKILNNEKYHK